MSDFFVRADGTYLIEGMQGDNPKLLGRELVDGRDSLYLEFYLGREVTTSRNGRSYTRALRRQEKLGLFLWRSPRSAQERRHNKEVLERARIVYFERRQEMLLRGGKSLSGEYVVDVIAWMRSYLDRYEMADRRCVKRAVVCFCNYLSDPEGRWLHRRGMSVAESKASRTERERLASEVRLPPKGLTPEVVRGYRDYLMAHYRGDGPRTTLKRFKRMVRVAVEAGVLVRNPCDGISISGDENVLRKDVLSPEEVVRLAQTHYAGESEPVRRAFIFCLYTGMRWCDVKELRFANVDFSNRMLRFEQLKTRGHSSCSGVTIPLNDGLLRLIGSGERERLIFELPTHTACLAVLRTWTAKAGIDKHITWHCARHSFAVNILNAGANIKTVSSLLGHSSLTMTEKYTRAVDSLKRAAIDSLPPLS